MRPFGKRRWHLTNPPDRFDVLTMGRVSVDLYPEQPRMRLSEARTFSKSLGGSPTNVAVGAARYGLRTAVITKVGDDPFGAYVRTALRGFGVDDRFVGTDPGLRTPLAFCEVFPPDRFPILFYREPKAPDMNLTPENVNFAAVREAKVLWTTGTGLADEPSRSTTLRALEARQRAPFTVHDLDYRAQLWRSADEARVLQRRAMASATVAVGNLEEVRVAVGDGQPELVAERLLALGPALVIVKLGPEGVLIGHEDGLVRFPPVPVHVVNGLGAGDAFGAALCHGLLGGWDLPRIISFASAAGAYVAGQLACADAMPTEEQVRRLMTHDEGW